MFNFLHQSRINYLQFHAVAYHKPESAVTGRLWFNMRWHCFSFVSPDNQNKSLEVAESIELQSMVLILSGTSSTNKQFTLL